MARRFTSYHFTGLDINEKLIHDGEKILASAVIKNIHLVLGDLHNAGNIFSHGQFDGIISLQTLSWLDGYQKAIKCITALKPKWIGLTSLFYDGPIETRCQVKEFNIYDAETSIITQLFYNTYSLPIFKNFLSAHRYPNIQTKKFEIPIDLVQNPEKRLGTYTEKTIDGKRLQISGPLLMGIVKLI